MRQLAYAILAATLLLVGTAGLAAELSMTDEQTQRYQALIAELRCLVCQNQNIADSNAPLAQDLRAQVQEKILAGQSDTEIKRYLVERYGDFVLYRPPVKRSTWLLWGGPFLLLLLGLSIAWRIFVHRGREAASSQAPDPEALARALEREKDS